MFFRVKENKLTNPLIVIKSFAIIIFLRSLDVHRFLRGAAEAAAGRGIRRPPVGRRGELVGTIRESAAGSLI